MNIAELLSPADVFIDVRAVGKSQMLKELCRHAAERLQLKTSELAESVLKREKLGSTGVGGGIAIPHARLAGLDRPFGVFARLKPPIDFEAVDSQPVDLVFLLLLPASPDGGQLSALACVARSLRDRTIVGEVRRARETAGVFAALGAT